MTKRVCSAVLALVMVMSLFTGLTPRVSAEDTYEKTVSVSPDDVVLLVCEGAGVELGGISAASPRYGSGESFDAAPAGAFPLTVVEGYAQGTFAFRNGDSYLCWLSGNSLNTADSADAGASWIVSFDADGEAVIRSYTDPSRRLWWNAANSCFACYTDKTAGEGYYSVQLYLAEPSDGKTWSWDGNAGDNGYHIEICAEDGSARQVACTQGEGVTDPVPTCTSGGVETFYCTVCGAVTTSVVLPMAPPTFVDGVCTVCGASETVPDVYAPADYIRDGDRILFVWPDDAAPRAAGPMAAGTNYLSAVEAVSADGNLTASQAIVFEVEARPAGKFAFRNNGRYLAPSAAESGSNSICLNEDPVDWTVSIAFGVATVSCPISETQTRYLRYNDALSRFSSYLSGQEEIAIYRLKTDEDLVDVYFVDEDDNNRAYACCTNTSSGETSAFPGPELTACGLEKGGHPYYKITVDRSKWDHVIFSGGGSETQTAELELGTAAYLVYYIQNHGAIVGADIWPESGTVVAPTCTEPGCTRYTGLLTGALVETDLIAALGHDYGNWSPNGDNTHTRVCANDASHAQTEFCADSSGDGICDTCGGALNEPVNLPEHGVFVIAAKVGDKYYALPGTFDEDNPNGVEITVVDGCVGERDAKGYAFTLELLEDNAYTISNGTCCLGSDASGSALQKLDDETTPAGAFRWRITEGSNGTYRVNNLDAPDRVLAYRAGSASGDDAPCFGVYAAAERNSGDETYFDLELLPIVKNAEAESPENIDIYFIDETNSAQAYAFYTDKNKDESDTSEDLQLPGVNLEACGVEKGGHSYYKLTLNTGNFVKVVFNNGQTGGVNSGNQTAELQFPADAREDPLDPAGNRYVVYSIFRDNGILTATVVEDVWPAPAERREPTCTEPGWSRYVGLRTGQYAGQTELPARGHSPGRPTQENRVEPTCTAPGSYDMVVRCSVCGTELTREHETVESLGHDWDEWQTDYAPTCTDRGVDYRICTRCNQMEQRDVDELGHEPGEPVQENYLEPTVTTEGGYDTVVYCTRCNAELSREHIALPATGPSEPALDESLTLYSSISVGVEIRTTFGVRRTQVQNYDRWYIEISKLDADGNVTASKRFGPGQEGTVEDGYIINAVYTDITAKEMGITYTATLHCINADGSEVYSRSATNTLRDYLIGEFTNADNPAQMRTLCADMLNYGAAAQVFFDYDAANLVNQNLSAAAAAAKAQYETRTEAPANLVNSGNGPNLYGSVSIMNRVVLGLTARGLGTGDTVRILVKEHATGETKATLDTIGHGGVYTAEYDRIEAEDMRTEFDFVTVVDGVETGNVLTWSVEGYVRACRENADASAEEVALLNAVLVYVDSAARANFNAND